MGDEVSGSALPLVVRLGGSCLSPLLIVLKKGKNIELCQQNEPNDCEVSLKIAYSALAAPFYINRYPFKTLGFGDYLTDGL